MGEAALLELEDVLTDLDLVPASQNVDRLFLLVVNMQRRTAVWRDLDDEVVEGATGVVAGDLENEIATGPGLEAKPRPGREPCIEASSRASPLLADGAGPLGDILHTRKQKIGDLLHCVK